MKSKKIYFEKNKAEKESFFKRTLNSFKNLFKRKNKE